jgi:hypothetical protein
MSWITKTLAFLLAIIAINPNPEVLGVKVLYIIDILLILFVLTRTLLFNAKWSLLIGLLMFSTFLAWNIGGWHRITLLIGYIGNLITLFLLSGWINHKIFVSKVLANITIIFSLFAVYIIYFSLIDPSQIDSFYFIASEGIRLSGFYDNPNIFGGLVLISNIGLLSLFQEKNRLLLFIGILLHIVVSFLTQSRSLIVVILFYNFVFVCLRERRLMWYFGVLVFCSLGFLHEIDFGRLEGLSNLGGTFKSERSFIFKAAIEAISRFPLGIGFQEQHSVIGDLTGVYKTPHNSFIADLLRFGWIFGPLWFVFWSVPMVNLVRLKRLTDPITMMLIGYLLYLAMSFAHALTTWWVFWWLVLLLHRSPSHKQDYL